MNVHNIETNFELKDRKQKDTLTRQKTRVHIDVYYCENDEQRTQMLQE